MKDEDKITNRKIGVIVDILYNYETTLSDAYEFYTGEGNVDSTLKDIAKEILKEIELNEKRYSNGYEGK